VALSFGVTMRFSKRLIQLVALTAVVCSILFWFVKDTPTQSTLSSIEVTETLNEKRISDKPLMVVSETDNSFDEKPLSANLVFILKDSVMNELVDEEVRIQGAEKFVAYTDNNGKAYFNGIPIGSYQYVITSNLEHPQLEGSERIDLTKDTTRVVNLQIAEYGQTISGRVLNQKEEPVQDFVISAKLYRRPTTNSPQLQQSDIKTSTDIDGRFEIDRLQLGEYKLSFDSERYVKNNYILHAPMGQAVLYVVENHVQNVEGTVTDSNGTPLQNVKVIPPTGSSDAVLTDQYGKYSLRAEETTGGRRYLRFVHSGYKEERLILKADVFDNDEFLLADMVLTSIEETVVVSGKVVDEYGQGIRGQRIQFHSPTRFVTYRATSNALGEFKVKGVQRSNDYRLWIRPKKLYRDYLMNPVAMLENETNLDIALISIGMGALSGRVIDEQQNPVPIFKFWIRSESAKGKIIEVMTDANGSFMVDNIPAGKLTIGSRSQSRVLMNNIELITGANKYIDITMSRNN